MFFYRYTAMSRHAAGMRQANDHLKTQIRFVDKDIRLFTKERGTDDPFQEYDMSTLESEVQLPGVDYSVKWSMKQERQPWRRTSPTTEKVSLKSLRNVSPSSQPALKKNKVNQNVESPSNRKETRSGNMDTN